MTNNFDYCNNMDEARDFMFFIQKTLGCIAIYTAIRDDGGNIEDFYIDYVNDAGCQSFQILREEQVGKRMTEFMPFYKETQLFDNLCCVVKSDKPFYKENLVLKNINNSERNLIVDLIAIKYNDGCAVTWWNKNETEGLREALKESEECFRGAFENAAIGMALTGINGRHIKVNNSLCEMTGYTENELHQMTFMDITYKDDLEKNLIYFRQALEGKIKHYHMEKRVIHKDGHIIWANLSSSLVRDAKGTPLYFTTQIQDITKIKQANEAIEYDKLKTDFFANISHELRTPLNVILASIQLLELQMKKDIEIKVDKVRKSANIVKQNCYRLLRLVNNLIDVTKIDTGFYELQLQAANIVNLIESITTSVAEYAASKDVSIQFETDIEEKIMRIDIDKIERIMLNLLSNAIKFSELNGNILVNVHDKGDTLSVSVKDSGIGIPPDKQETIFQRFRQVSPTLTRTNEGSGIGLSLVRSLVEMHGGQIRVNSKVGEGSEFIFELPVKQEAGDNTNQVNYKSDRNYFKRINVEFSDLHKM